MKFVSPFQPLNFWAQGPWMFFNMGLQFMQTWQEECFSRLRLMPVATRPIVPGSAERVMPAVPAAQSAAAAEIQSLNAAIAARQGRDAPLLGCLQNVQVVGGPESVKAEKPEKSTPSAKATVKPATTKAPALAAKAAVSKPKAAVVKEKPAVLVQAPAAVEPAEEEPMMPAPAAGSSVTSMLAMQAKSLAKAVKTAPAQAAVSKSAAKTAAKPATKLVTQSAAKADAMPVAKVEAAAAVAKSATKPANKSAAKPASAPSKKA